VVQSRYLEVERGEEGFRDWNGEEDAAHIILNCPETRKLREHLLSRKWQN
jgi:hypothetical protein